MPHYVDADRIIKKLLLGYKSVRDPLDKVGVHEVIKVLNSEQEERNQKLSEWLSVWIDDLQRVVDREADVEDVALVIASMKDFSLEEYDVI